MTPMTLSLALLLALCVAALSARAVTTPRGLLLALHALAGLLDAAAVLCGALVFAVDAAAWAVCCPVLALARGCLRASRRITHGRAP